MMTSRFLTASDVAELLQLNVETVYSLISKVGLPAAKIGGQWRLSEDDVQAWIKERTACVTQRAMNG
jgi:excisionase family DNA binding protein